jgi:hypothetical protein
MYRNERRESFKIKKKQLSIWFRGNGCRSRGNAWFNDDIGIHTPLYTPYRRTKEG